MKLTIDALRITKDGKAYGPWTADLLDVGRVAVLGGSSPERTALAEVIAGVIPSLIAAPYSGKLSFEGIDQLPLLLHQRRANFGFVFQDPEAMLCTLDVRSELAFELENIGLSQQEIQRRVDATAETMGIAHLLDRGIYTLSAGQLQRVALASMYVTGARVILYDEPYKNIDPAGRAEFRAMIDVARERGLGSMIFSSQLHEEWYRYDTYLVQAGSDFKAVAGWKSFVDFLSSARTDHSIVVPTELAIIQRLKSVSPSLVDAIGVSNAGTLIWPSLPRFKIGDHHSATKAIDARAKLRLHHVTYQYPTTSAGVEDVSLTVNGPGITAVVGSNGAGKSTLAKVLSGLLRPSRGTVHIDGVEIASAGFSEIAKRVSYVFQDPRHQFVTDSVREEIRFGMPDSPDLDIEAETTVIANTVGLGSQLSVHPYRLAPSEQRLLSLGAAIASKKEILIVDEPTYGLDRAGLERTKRLLVKLCAQGRTILLISHDMDFLADVATWCLTLEKGTVKFSGALSELTEHDTSGMWPTSRNFLKAAGVEDPGRRFVPTQLILSALDELC